MPAKLASKTRLGIRKQMVARKISVKVCPDTSGLAIFKTALNVVRNAKVILDI
jgi:hypothetical protein